MVLEKGVPDLGTAGHWTQHCRVDSDISHQMTLGPGLIVHHGQARIVHDWSAGIDKNSTPTAGAGTPETLFSKETGSSMEPMFRNSVLPTKSPVALGWTADLEDEGSRAPDPAVAHWPFPSEMISQLTALPECTSLSFFQIQTL